MQNRKADIFEYIAADHESLRGILNMLADSEVEVFRKRIIFQRMLPFFRAHTYGVEHSLLSTGLGYPELRPVILKCVEQHELVEVCVQRMSVATIDEVWHARLGVFCQLLERHLADSENIFPRLKLKMAKENKEKLGMKYLDTRNKFHMSPVSELPNKPELAYDQTGKIGYLVAWLLGVPAWILILVFLIRG